MCKKRASVLLAGGLVLILGLAVARVDAQPSGPAAVLSPDGKLVASASDQAIVVSDTASQKTLLKILGHTGKVTALAFSPDGKLLASGGTDKTVRLWEVATGKELLALSGHTAVVITISIATDGKSLTSQGANREQKIWDIATGKLIGQSAP